MSFVPLPWPFYVFCLFPHPLDSLENRLKIRYRSLSIRGGSWNLFRQFVLFSVLYYFNFKYISYGIVMMTLFIVLIRPWNLTLNLLFLHRYGKRDTRDDYYGNTGNNSAPLFQVFWWTYNIFFYILFIITVCCV